MAFLQPGRGQAQAQINITPLVDVVLVLLIVFLVALPTVTTQLPVEVPTPADASVDPRPALVVRVAADLSVRIDGSVVGPSEVVPLTSLAAQLRRALVARSPDPDGPVVFVDVDPAVRWADAADVLDTVRGMGPEVRAALVVAEAPAGGPAP